VPAGCGRETVDQPLRPRAGGVEDARRCDHLERGEARCGRQRVARQRPRLVHGPGWRELIHQIGAPAERARGKASANHLAEHGEVGFHAVDRLRSAQRDAKARHHLVEHEQGTVERRQVAQPLQVAGPGKHHTHVAGHRLENHAGDPAAVRLEHRPRRVEIVERDGQRRSGKGGRHTRACGRPEGRGAAACLDERPSTWP
jgi:hypothetical protein